MKYVLSGIETMNKGAELMLYAILQQIGLHDSDAVVYVPNYALHQGISYLKTDVDVRYKFNRNIEKIAETLHIPGMMRRLGVSDIIFTDHYPLRDIDYFIDASGFQFSDQWPSTKYRLMYWEKKLSYYHAHGTKCIFLPQAFGPINDINTKKLISIIGMYADLIFPREEVSLNYMLHAGVNPSKMCVKTDFTSLVDGMFPSEYEHLRGQVCFIPNCRMLDRSNMTIDKYKSLLNLVIEEAESVGRKVYLLNHEGIHDESIAYKLSRLSCKNLTVVSGLNALEVKGLISASYLCITSRYHGLASALNSCVPSLCTSWSHKYECLYRDYDIPNGVLDTENIDKVGTIINQYLNPQFQYDYKIKLSKGIDLVKASSLDMWMKVWKI